MSKNRYINTKFWSDGYVSNLDPVEKLLFLYLLSNDKTNICGIYELPLKYMAIETGIDKEMIIKILERFQKEKKIFYINGWICITNFIKHQNFQNINIKKGIESCLSEVPKEILTNTNTLECLPDDSSVTPICLSNNLIKFNLNYNINNNTNDSSKKASSLFDGKLSSNEKQQQKLDSKLEKQEKILKDLFDVWNSLKIIQHLEFKSGMKSGLQKQLKEYDYKKIKRSMKNYAYIVHSKDYYFNYKWTLEEFLFRGKGKNIERFLDLKTAKENFAINKKENNNAGIII